MATDISRDGAILGSGDHVYRAVNDWARLPDGYHLQNDVGIGRGRPRRQRVRVQSRAAPGDGVRPTGNYCARWGEGYFHAPHGAQIAPDETIYLTDDGDHSVRKFTLDGKLLLTLGSPARPRRS